MKKDLRWKNIIKLLENLPEEQAENVVNTLYLQLSGNKTNVNPSSLTGETVTACRHCGSTHFFKNGKDRKGQVCFVCKDCGKSFGEKTDSAISGTWKSTETWKTYIAALIEGCTLEVCARRCGISVPTAFVWRHKILSALTAQLMPQDMDGVIEMDEMYVKISYKGNHTQSRNFAMPRPAYKRGTDNRVPGNSNKASVLCMVERNKRFSGLVPCKGVPNAVLLAKTLGPRLSSDSIVLTDGLHIYNQYFENTAVEHVILRARSDKKATVKGAYHINNVNALHGRFRSFLEKYKGVATKYLNNYLALFLWLENHKQENRQEQLCNELSRVGAYMPAVRIRQIAPEPEFAPAA